MKLLLLLLIFVVIILILRNYNKTGGELEDCKKEAIEKCELKELAKKRKQNV